MDKRILIDGQVESAQGESSEVTAPVSFLPGEASGDGRQGVAGTQSSAAGCNHCTDALHELANTITAVLMNAQVMEWRLPPYSRLKRPAREIERHAQRSSELLRRLLCQLEATEDAPQELCRQVPSLHGTMVAATARGPEATAAGSEKLPALARSPSARGSWFTPEKELTRSCDPCTSAFFPKEER